MTTEAVSTEALQRLECLVRAVWDREAERRMATLRMIPSTGMRWFLDQYDSLAPREQALLLSGLSKQAACIVAGVPIVQLPASESEAGVIEALDERYKNTRWMDWRYTSLATLKMMLSEGYDPDWLPDRAAEWVRSVVTAKAADRRKAIRPVLQGHGYVNISEGKSEFRWSTPGEDGFVINFDFGGMDSQLRYEVRPARTRVTPLSWHCPLGFEGVLGLIGFCSSNGNWDTIELQHVDEAAALVVELIDRVVAFLKDAETVMRRVS